MTAFAGESLPVVNVGNTAGAAFLSWEAVAYRAGLSTFAGGDEAWADVALSPLLLTGADDAVVSWVLEVVGGSGTLDLSEDAGPLGSFSVTAGEIVVPSSLTAADVLAGGTVRLTVSCTSGTVDVQQVKLRVWPPTGVLGGWSDVYQPDAVRVGFGTPRACAFDYTTPTYLTGSDLDTVFNDVQDTLGGLFNSAAIGDPVYLDSDTDNALGVGFRATSVETYGADPAVQGEGRVAGGVIYLERIPLVTPVPPGTFGVDWTYPPNEVPDDPDGWDVTGSGSWDWWQNIGTIVETADYVGPPSGSFHVGGNNVADVDPPSATFGDLTGVSEIGALAGGGGSAEFTMPPIGDTGLIRLTAWHDGSKATLPAARAHSDGLGRDETTGFAQASVYPGRFIGETFDPAAAAYTAGAFRYWTLTPATPKFTRIMQRGDGLGMGSGRVYSTGTRQASTRVFGTH